MRRVSSISMLASSGFLGGNHILVLHRPVTYTPHHAILLLRITIPSNTSVLLAA